MDESRLKRLTPLVSAAAVAISLVFVGLEVRETARQTQLNTEASQVAAYQDLISQIADFNTTRLDPEIAAVCMKSSDRDGDWSKLTPLEQNQSDRLLFLLVRHADMEFYQFEKGLLPEERLASALRPFLGDIEAPIHRRFWGNVKGNFVQSFRDYIDAQIALQ